MSAERKNASVLAVGLGLLAVSNGNWIVPVAAWLGPVFILRFLRDAQRTRTVVLGGLGYVGVFELAWRGMIAVPGLWYYAVAGGIGAALLVPFLADRHLVRRMKGFAGTLVFPLAYAVVEYVGFQFTPFGTWGSLAYTQFGNLPLMQVVSLTGIYGLTFLIAWFASVVNWMWEQRFQWSVIQRGVTIFAGVAAGVLLFGGASLAFRAPVSPEVKVAGVQSSLAQELMTPAMQWFYEGDVTKADWNDIFARSKLVSDDLFSKSQAAARAGARIVAWSEASVTVSKAEEPRFLERGRALARQERIYLAMAYAVNLHTDPTRLPREKMMENKVAVAGPTGDLLSTYRKTIPVPGLEAQLSDAGHGDATVLTTPYGRLTALICYDNDFPSFVRTQAGMQRTDILVDPSGDWEGIDPYHTHMMAFRAIENGLSVVRVTSSGLSAAYDYQGRTLAAMDYFKTDDLVFTAFVPQRGVTTLYAKVGDVFAWAAIAGLATVIAHVALKSRTSASPG